MAGHMAQLRQGSFCTHFKLKAVDFDHPEWPKDLGKVGGFITAPKRETEIESHGHPPPCARPPACPMDSAWLQETCCAMPGVTVLPLPVCRCPHALALGISHATG